MKKKSPRTPEQMDWPTYNYIRSLIEVQIELLEKNYLMSHQFIPTANQSASDAAHKIFTDKRAELKSIIEQFHTTVAGAYKTHPTKEMREFWGLTE